MGDEKDHQETLTASDRRLRFGRSYSIPRRRDVSRLLFLTGTKRTHRGGSRQPVIQAGLLRSPLIYTLGTSGRSVWH